MNRPQHAGVPHAAAALVHRGPQAITAPHAPHSPLHAPNAALLIDFDNVTMGIRSDLATELRNLLSSDIIRGKVAVQRAYADWRRYPNYVVTLAESSIDMIMAPAYGSSKKNATDIRLAIDALELVFTRPEIGTFILLSGDSDFSSLVIKLKEYGKYVIGVGIRESSSDLLVMNCDEYYSWNALTGLVRAAEEEQRKWDPWELVTEAVQRMKRNGDVMRSDRLKQVMQELDSSFDEKNLGMAKFSRFVQEASHRGLLSVTKLDNGQLEIDTPAPAAVETRRAPIEPEPEPSAVERGAPGSGGRRPRRGRGRDRSRGRDRDARHGVEPLAAIEAISGSNGAAAIRDGAAVPPAPGQFELTPESTGAVGVAGERLTRDEAFDLVRRAVESLTTGDDAVRASDVRRRARELLGRDSESLSERNFARILRDAHDGDVIDLRRRGDDFEVARAIPHLSVADQLSVSAPPPPTPPIPMPALPGPRMGIGVRGTGPRGRGGRIGPPPPELLSVGIVPASAPLSTDPPPSPVIVEPTPPPVEALSTEPEPVAEPEPKRGGRSAARRGRGRKQATKRAAARGSAADVGAATLQVDVPPEVPAVEEAPSVRRGSRTKTAAKSRRSRKPAPRGGEE